MHRLPSKKAIFNFRMAALLLWVKVLLPISAFGVLIYGGVEKDRNLVICAAGMFVITGILGLIQWLYGTQTRCPLCITPVLAGRTCSKNRKSKKFLGSYRLRVANNILLNNYFRCPYCSEPTTLEVRTSRHRHAPDEHGHQSRH